MSANPEAAMIVDDTDGWQQVVPKKRIQRTDTATSVKSTTEKPKKKGSAAPSRTSTNVSVKSSRGFGDRKPAEPLEKNLPLLEPVRVIDALRSHRPMDGENTEKDGENKDRKKEKKARAAAKKKAAGNAKSRMFGQSTSFGANVAPVSAWRPSSPSRKSDSQSSDVVEGGKVVVIPSSNMDATDEDLDEDDEAYYSDDSDYSDDDGEDDGVSSRTHAESIPESVAVAAAVAASKGPSRGILRTSTAGGTVPNVAFDSSAIDAAILAATENRAVDAPQRSSTLPSGKYVPPMLRTDSQFSTKGVKLDITNVQFKPVAAPAPAPATTTATTATATATADVDGVTASIDEHDENTNVEEEVVAADSAEDPVPATVAASQSQSQKPKRTNTGNSTTYHKKGTPGVFKNKDRTMDIDWRIHRTGTNTSNAGAVSRTNTTNATQATPVKEGKEGKEVEKTKQQTEGTVSRSNTNNNTNTTQNGKVSRSNTANGKVSRTNTADTSKKANSPVKKQTAIAAATTATAPAPVPATSTATPAATTVATATATATAAPATATSTIADVESDNEVEAEVTATSQRKKGKNAAAKSPVVAEKKKKKTVVQPTHAGPVMSQQHWRMVVGVVLVILVLRFLGLL